jgi:hypothetical protein
VSRLASSALALLLLAGGVHAADGVVQLSPDAERIAFGLFLDTPLPAASIEKSLDVLSGLRCRYGLHGGVRDDEEAARRAFEEIDGLTFTPKDRARMAERLGVSLAPALCGEACEQFENLVLLKLRMEALEKLAAAAAPACRHEAGAHPND